ncbi:MAG: 3-deoxy-manno-octulosonate cytidylyltransferase [Acidobacteria bacterium]|nr:3-deoxy-manno-octulosonate cytidylyltransferase [Acidobacteriota bacterium]MSO62978.1 3-deoxy-manno-octulosonate cytidylyltransferase [Acidobacteriota bacterium]
MTESSVLAVIPARFHSTRLPGKILADIAGHPMIEYVYRRTAAAALVHAALVATDDERIARAVELFGGAAVMTRTDHASGTDRIAEVVAQLPCRLVVNVQGDEPLIEPDTIDAAIAPLLADATLEMSTLCRPLAGDHELAARSVVKVITDLKGRALHFSRSPMPGSAAHIGLYVYRRDVLLKLAALPAAPLETLESLEQLRAVAHGIGIRVVPTRHGAAGVDTPEDLERVRHLLVAPEKWAPYMASART